MAVLTQNVALTENRTEETRANRAASPIPSSSFKYYIHDSVATLRFQIIGDLRGANVTELNGSWETSKTTLKFRRLVLDLSGLDSVDEAGRRWLSKMKDAGAAFLPTEHFEFGVRAPRPPMSDGVKAGLVGRLLAIFKPKP